MKQYEFKHVRLDDERWYANRGHAPDHGGEPKTILEQLNELGAEGWQVVQRLEKYDNSSYYLLQRERMGHPYRG